jgi:hypothetical protein
MAPEMWHLELCSGILKYCFLKSHPITLAYLALIFENKLAKYHAYFECSDISDERA